MRHVAAKKNAQAAIAERKRFMVRASLLLANAKADQRRTTDSSTPLDSIRRLIQRVVIRFYHAANG
jgi:hypothetical protein